MNVVKVIQHFLGHARNEFPPLPQTITLESPLPFFSLAQIPGPPKLPLLHEPNASIRIVKDCARYFMSLIYTSIMPWFTKRTPKALIAGMHLTRNEAQDLVQALQELERSMERQIEEIEAFQEIRGRDDARRALESIRERHHHIYKRLDSLALCLRDNHLKKALGKELEQAAASMAGKRILWNDRSRPLELGWKAAAERYWPRTTNNYAALLETLNSFKQDVESILGDEARERDRRTSHKSLKSALKDSSRTKPKPQSNGKHVVFEGTFHQRIFSDEDAPKEVGEVHADTEWHVYGCGTDSVGRLASDRTDSTKDFHTRAHGKENRRRNHGALLGIDKAGWGW